MPAIAPEKVLKDLGALWADLAKPAEASEHGVLRACAMTLIIALEPDDDPAGVGQTIAELMHDHPSRAIVLKPGSPGQDLDARVSAQCWMPFGKRQQVCCEQIEIATPIADAEQAARLILGLLAPDLPAVLWARGRAWLDSAGFGDLAPYVTKLIVDSERGCGIEAVRSLRQRARRVADLAWTRTTATRQEIARFFDDPRNAGALDGVNAVICPPDQPYLSAWLAVCLPGRKVVRDGRAGLIRIEGPQGALEFRILPPPESECALIAAELGIIGADPVFERVLAATEWPA
jgi:glucose-6-phosphate dehydrogenase assembly protein OpcA